MKYYKDTNNKPFVFEDNVTSEIIAKVEATHNTTLTEITLADYQAMIAPTLAELQSRKLGEIKKAFNMDATIEKIGVLNSGYTLASTAGATTMDIRDYNNVVHSGIAIGDVKTILLELGQNYQVQLSKKWSLEERVKSAATQVDLDAIIW